MADKTMKLGNDTTTVDLIANGKVVGSNIINKGSETKPIYFDENGIAQETTVDFLTSDDITNPDWDENDTTSPSYVENRTHWREEYSSPTIFPEQTLHFEENEYMGFLAEFTLQTPICIPEEETAGRFGYYPKPDTIILKINDKNIKCNENTSGMPVNMLGADSGEVEKQLLYFGEDEYGIYMVGFFPEYLDNMKMYSYTNGGIMIMPKVATLAIGSEPIETTVSIEAAYYDYHPLDFRYVLSQDFEEYINNAIPEVDGDLYLTKENPTGSGSFSLNRKADSTIGEYSFAEGVDTIASGQGSHSEGLYTNVGEYIDYSDSSSEIERLFYDDNWDLKTDVFYGSHAEGVLTNSNGIATHTEGFMTVAEQEVSHAEGWNTKAIGNSSHSEGYYTTASEQGSHSEGVNTTASGYASHAEGYNTKAGGSHSHAEGFYTKASSGFQHVQGKCNIEDTANTYAHIVGNGGLGPDCSNAHTLDWNGNAWFAGDVYIKSTSGKNKDDGSKKLATENLVSDMTNAQDDTKFAYGSESTTYEFLEQSDLDNYYTKTEIDTMVGDIEEALTLILGGGN